MPHEDYGCLDCGYRWSKELLPATQITKIRYKVVENGPCTIDFQQSWVYEIYPDGRCKEYTYQGQNRKYQFKMEEKVSEKKVCLQYLWKTIYNLTNRTSVLIIKSSLR